MSLDVSLTPRTLALVGANVIECCDRFSYQMDAEIVPEPGGYLASVCGPLIGGAICRSPDGCSDFPNAELAPHGFHRNEMIAILRRLPTLTAVASFTG